MRPITKAQRPKWSISPFFPTVESLREALSRRVDIRLVDATNIFGSSSTPLSGDFYVSLNPLEVVSLRVQDGVVLSILFPPPTL